MAVLNLAVPNLCGITFWDLLWMPCMAHSPAEAPATPPPMQMQPFVPPTWIVPRLSGEAALQARNTICGSQSVTAAFMAANSAAPDSPPSPNDAEIRGPATLASPMAQDYPESNEEWFGVAVSHPYQPNGVSTTSGEEGTVPPHHSHHPHEHSSPGGDDYMRHLPHYNPPSGGALDQGFNPLGVSPSGTSWRSWCVFLKPDQLLVLHWSLASSPLTPTALVDSQRENSSLSTALRDTLHALEARQWKVDQLRSSSRESIQHKVEYCHIINQFLALDRALQGPPGQSLLECFKKVEKELRVAKKEWDVAAEQLSTSSRKVSELTTILLHQQGVVDDANALATCQCVHLEELQVPAPHLSSQLRDREQPLSQAGWDQRGQEGRSGGGAPPPPPPPPPPSGGPGDNDSEGSNKGEHTKSSRNGGSREEDRGELPTGAPEAPPTLRKWWYCLGEYRAIDRSELRRFQEAQEQEAPLAAKRKCVNTFPQPRACPKKRRVTKIVEEPVVEEGPRLVRLVIPPSHPALSPSGSKPSSSALPLVSARATGRLAWFKAPLCWFN
ncbi:hypothetical protein F5877DRAFT_80667 [Lentinula edodes]|nr:hypothetical protein F5877DRAFT_80667 [Lentinula edodes]